MQKQKLFKKEDLEKNPFSLILSGGSSLGLAHIGTIKYLENHDLIPNEIIGTSMGSVIGSLYALGENHITIQEKLNNLKTEDLFEIKYLKGKIDYKKAKAFLKKMFGNKKISETKIPLKIIATKLKDGEEKIFTLADNVKIYDAVLASAAIPGILNAEKIKGELYIDGCVSSNLPLEAAKKENIKLAINVINKKKKNFKYSSQKDSLVENIKTRFEILRRSSYYYILEQTNSKITKTKKLILIEPNLKRFNSFLLKDYKKIIQSGYEETKDYFDKAEKLTSKKQKIKDKTALEKIKDKTKKIIKNIQKLE